MLRAHGDPPHAATTCRQAQHKSVEMYRRPTAREHLMRKKAATYGIPGRSSTPNEKGVFMFSIDPKDRFYSLGIVIEQREFLTIYVRGQLYRPARLPMGWSLSPYHFLRIHGGHIPTSSTPTRPGGFKTNN
jgi:hypothetical protein